MTPEASPIQQAFNLAVFGPLGIALAAKAALPEWIDKGRARAVEQFAMAKAVGEMVTDYGQHKVAEQLVGLGILPGPQPPAPPSPAAAAEPASAVAKRSPAPRASPATNGRSSRARSRGPGPVASGASPASSAPAPVAPAAAAPPVVHRDDLAIPGYDSLSASQVVSRLAGLAPDELESVRAYEAASRGRRTILTKISQLQTGRL